MHADDSHPSPGGDTPIAPTSDPMIAVVTVALDGSTCDKCGTPAVVAISLDAWRKPLVRCADCWPPLDEVLQHRRPTVSNY